MGNISKSVGRFFDSHISKYNPKRFSNISFPNPCNNGRSNCYGNHTLGFLDFRHWHFESPWRFFFEHLGFLKVDPNWFHFRYLLGLGPILFLGLGPIPSPSLGLGPIPSPSLVPIPSPSLVPIPSPKWFHPNIGPVLFHEPAPILGFEIPQSFALHVIFPSHAELG
jgi:hypothetical protein